MHTLLLKIPPQPRQNKQKKKNPKQTKQKTPNKKTPHKNPEEV